MFGTILPPKRGKGNQLVKYLLYRADLATSEMQRFSLSLRK